MYMLRSCGIACAALLSLIGVARAGHAEEVASSQLSTLLEHAPSDTAELRQALLALDVSQIRELCGMLKEPGAGGDEQVRYGLHGLALAVGDPGREERRDALARTLGEALHGEPQRKDAAFLIRQLGLAGGPEALKVLSDTLSSGEYCVETATALAALGAPEACAALRARLGSAEGRCQLAIIQLLGDLHDDRAAGELRNLAASPELEVRLAALNALARIGDGDAVDLLLNATEVGSWYERSRATDAVLALANRLAERGHDESAAAILRDLYVKHASPTDTHVRCAAICQLTKVLGARAVGDILAALADDDPQVRAAGAAAAVALQDPSAATALINGYSGADTAGRIALLDVFERRGEQCALPTVMAALEDEERSVRLAAIAVAASLGLENAVDRLIGVLAGENDDALEAAREALARIPGEATTQAIAAAMSETPANVKVQLLDVLARRPLVDPAPVFAASSDEDKEVRIAALRALGTLADEPALPRLLQLLSGADDDQEREAASEAVAAVARRCPIREAPASLIAAALEGQATEVRSALLRVLGQIGGSSALEAVSLALRSDNPELQEAAARALSEWPDCNAAAVALEFAQQTTNLKLHVLSLRAYIRMIAEDGNSSVDRKLICYRAALAAARRAEEKKTVVARLGDLSDERAFELLTPLLTEQSLRSEAASAIVNVAERLFETRWNDARTPLEAAAAADVPQPVQERVRTALAKLAEYDGVITDWWVAGPYTLKGKAGNELLDLSFPPEDDGMSTVAWKKQPLSGGATPPWHIDLRATMSGDHRAGYLLSRIYSPKEQAARLEVGSDDGVKVWLNRQMVHVNDALRGLTPSEDKVDVDLRPGWNTLLVKVTNNSGGWAACVRVRAPDGKPLTGVYTSAGDKP